MIVIRCSAAQDTGVEVRIGSRRSRVTTPSGDLDADSVYGFSSDWAGMPSTTQKGSTGNSCMNRAKSQSNVCCLEQTKNGTARLSRGKDRVRDSSEHSGGGGVIKWLRNSFRRSRSRSNSRKEKNGMESKSEGSAASVSYGLPTSKSKEILHSVPLSNVKNKVELFEQKSTKCSESSQVTENLNRYSLIKAQQSRRNGQVLSAHQAALSGEGVISSAKDPPTDLDTGGHNEKTVGDENVYNAFEMSSGRSQHVTCDSDRSVIGTHGGLVNKSGVQLDSNGFSGLTGRGDVPGMSVGVRTETSTLTSVNDHHLNHGDTCKNSVAIASLLATPEGHEKHEQRISQPTGRRSLLNYENNSRYKKTPSTGGTDRISVRNHKFEEVIYNAKSGSHTATKSTDHRLDQSNYIAHAQVHHNSGGHQTNATHSASEHTVDQQLIISGTNIERVHTGNDGHHNQLERNELYGTVLASNEIHLINNEYKNQLKNFGKKYFSSVAGSLQNVSRASPKLFGGTTITEDSPPSKRPVPLETHFDCEFERPESVCSASTYSETMVSCKEAIQKATTVISRSKSPIKPDTPEEIASKIKAYEQMHRGGSPASELSKAGSASGSDVSGSHANKSIISKIENVGTHSSYFHASDITGNCKTEVTEKQKNMVASGGAEKMDKEGTESSVWNESESEHTLPTDPPQPLNHSTPRVFDQNKYKELYKGNWCQLNISSPSLPCQLNTQNKQRSTSISSELCTSSLTDTSTLEWNSCADNEYTTTGSVELSGKGVPVLKSMSLSPSQFTQSIPRKTGCTNRCTGCRWDFL